MLQFGFVVLSLIVLVSDALSPISVSNVVVFSLHPLAHPPPPLSLGICFLSLFSFSFSFKSRLMSGLTGDGFQAIWDAVDAASNKSVSAGGAKKRLLGTSGCLVWGHRDEPIGRSFSRPPAPPLS